MRHPRRRQRVALLAATAIASAALGFLCLRQGEGYALARMPVATVDAGYVAARANPRTIVLGDLDSSALMLWRHPDMRRRVAFDPRLEIYRQSDLDRWFAFTGTQGPAWFALARRADIVLAAKVWQSELARQLARPRAGWHAIATRDGIVLLRDRLVQPAGSARARSSIR
jgi:hypothetical protein